ncbi:MAG: TlyA family RNA methyltransferase [Promethearchaeota archaeon]|nr:MAG: TlyA family RNA methyltransferase [Candidatus Lokiarchaeota archaeon]
MKERIDILLVEKRLVESRSKAKWLIKNGYVLANKKQIIKPSKRIDKELEIQLIEEFPYVSRGGLKLEAALKQFAISVKEKICADIGVSVGGFTDCLLKHGALKVYAIDTATEILHPSLICKKKQNKIVPILGVDARNLIPVKEEVDICTIDVTFASLKSILPNVKKILNKNGEILALVKPTFEIEFHECKKFRIIQDPKQLFQILIKLIQWSIKNQFFPYNIIKSPLLAKEGSSEFFIHLGVKKKGENLNFENLIKEMLKQN